MIPYRQVAKDALINWNGLSEEEATKKAMTETIESLENQVWAMGSIKSATKGLSTSLNLTEEESKILEDAVINGPEDAEIFKIVTEKAKENKNINGLILDDLSHIHDDWVKANSDEKTFNKKVDREQLRQYAPLELIGWNEAKSDLLFLEPVLNSVGIQVDHNLLEQTYHERVEKFIKEKGCKLPYMIEKGKEFYPALTEELAEKIKPLAKTVADQIRTNLKEKDPKSFEIYYAELSRQYEMQRAADKERAKKAAQEKIPSWIERGQALISPERYAEWTDRVQASVNDLYHGAEIEDALEIMTALENGATMEEAKQIFDKQDHSNWSGSVVRNILFSFSNKGPEFWEATAYGEISPEDKQLIEAKKQENIQLAQQLSKEEQTQTNEFSQREPLDLDAVSQEIDAIGKIIDDATSKQGQQIATNEKGETLDVSNLSQSQLEQLQTAGYTITNTQNDLIGENENNLSSSHKSK